MPRSAKLRTEPYALAVPAVTRALDVLERLAVAPTGLTLAELSRAVDASPSSTLAILTTLCGRGYLRKEASGGYRLGSAAGRLSATAQTASDLLVEFQPVAERLTHRTGETVLLWGVEGGEAVVLAGCPGQRTLRVVPRIGARASLRGSAPGQIFLATLAGELATLPEPLQAVARQGWAEADDPVEDGLRMLACPIWQSSGLLAGVLGLAGPAERLGRSRPAAVQALLVAGRELSQRLGWTGDRAAPTADEPSRAAREWPRLPTGAIGTGASSRPSDWWTGASGGLDAEEVDRFLAGGLVARLACLKENGYPYTVPVWYEWDGQQLWVVPRARAAWARYLLANPQVSLSIDEDEPPMRRVLIEGHAEVVETLRPTGQWLPMLARMARRYLGDEGDRYLATMATQPHCLFRIVPEKITTWRGLASHPRYQGPAGEGVA